MASRRVALLAVGFAVVLALALPAAGAASPYALAQKLDAKPPGFSLTARRAIAVAKRTPAVQKVATENGPLQAQPAVPLGRTDWQIGFFHRRVEVARVTVDGTTGRVVGPVLTGFQIAWPAAAGTKTAFRDHVDWTTVVLCFIFFLPFLDPRRLSRILHLDLLALIGFEVSFLCLQTGHLDLSVSLQYVPLLYLLARLAWIAFSRGPPQRDPGRLVPFASDRVLGGGLVALVAARLAWNVVWGPVGDVGYASLFGADSLVHGYDLYSASAPHLDAYGPVNYFFYIPFVTLFPLGEGWSIHNAQGAHVATITLDLAVIALLMLVGRRLVPGAQGRRLGLALGFAWAAYPFAFLPFALNANDAMVAVVVLGALLAYGSPVGRGVVLGLGAAAKFGPAALVPVFALGRERSVRQAMVVVGMATAIFVLAFLPYVRQSGLHTVWDRTLGFQLNRASPFTLWGLHASLDWVHLVAQALAVAVVAAATVLPRERSLPALAALSAAVLIAVQMAGTYWAHTYVAWFAAPALVALLGSTRTISTSGRNQTM